MKINRLILLMFIQNITIFVARGQVIPFLNDVIDPSRQNPDLLYGSNDKVLGDPYLVEEFNLGNIKLSKEKTVFENIKIKYDIYDNQLVINHRGSTGVLNSKMIEWFSLYIPEDAQYHKFVNIAVNNKASFYEEVASAGSIVIYKKQYKRLVKGQPADGYNTGALSKDKFVYGKKYYLRKADGSYVEIDNLKKNLVDNLIDDSQMRKRLASFIKKKHLRFKKNEDQDIIAVFTYLKELF